MTTEVLVLGASGMLGSMVTDYLSRNTSFHVTATVRSAEYLNRCKSAIEEADWRLFSVGERSESIDQLISLGRFDWIVNAVGIIKPYARDEHTAERENAIRINALFPYWLGAVAEQTGARVLQIATDCVYSGTKGHYAEADKHDALDVYGKTKSLGEVPSEVFHHLRCSIIGPETKSYLSLQEWFLKQPQRAQIKGFTNHMWNGVTTLHFAKVCDGIMARQLALPSLQHIVPTGDISKDALLNVYASVYGRQDIQIAAVEAPTVVNRTLKTDNPSVNMEVWRAAGYLDHPPTVEQMVEELGAFDFRLKGVLES